MILPYVMNGDGVQVIGYFEVTVTDPKGNLIFQKIYPGDTIFEASAVFEHEEGSNYKVGTIISFKSLGKNK